MIGSSQNLQAPSDDCTCMYVYVHPRFLAAIEEETIRPFAIDGWHALSSSDTVSIMPRVSDNENETTDQLVTI